MAFNPAEEPQYVTKFKQNIMIIRKIVQALTVCALFAAMSSCIKDEPLNSECDILEVTVPGDVLNREPVISNNKVTLVVKNGVDVRSLAPEFKLSEGATIDPPGGTVRNFTNPQSYTTTSQDGEWHKTYIIEVQHNNSAISLEYDFENVRHIKALGGMCTYDEFYELGVTGQDALVWASANSAFALTLQGSTPNTFPTYQGDDGNSDGVLVPVEGKRDMFNLYAVLYETSAGHEWLDGSNVLSQDNPMIICTAEIPDRQECSQWRPFSVPFKYRAGKSIDPVKLHEGKYNIAIVMSSSQDGDYFCGAIGSTLQVDELSITCEE